MCVGQAFGSVGARIYCCRRLRPSLAWWAPNYRIFAATSPTANGRRRYSAAADTHAN